MGWWNHKIRGCLCEWVRERCEAEGGGGGGERRTDRQTKRVSRREGGMEKREKEKLGVLRPVNQYGYIRTRARKRQGQRETEGQRLGGG